MLLGHGDQGAAAGRLLVDQKIPTRERIEASRPDLVVKWVAAKKIVIMDVACTWKPLIETREKKKYQELAGRHGHQVIWYRWCP